MAKIETLQTIYQSDQSVSLSPVEREIIDLFIDLSRLLGQAPSLAEIYGLLFITVRPMTMDDLTDRLLMSKGSASQGLKALRNLGAVKTVYVPGDRRAHYEAVTELRNSGIRIIRDQIVPQLDSGQTLLDQIADLLRQRPTEDRARLDGRVNDLQYLVKSGGRFLSTIVRFLDRSRPDLRSASSAGRATEGKGCR